MKDQIHRVLVVEDDVATSRLLIELVSALGMSARVAATLEEVETALGEEEFCAALLDKQIPATSGHPPLSTTGDTAQRRLRTLDPRRTRGDHHVFPILVITGAAQDFERAREVAFVSRNYRDGASVYISKPFDADTVTSELSGAMERAGRVDHARCGALRASARPRAAARGAKATPSAPPATAGAVHLVLDGLRIGRRMTFLVNGKRRDLPDAIFVALLRLAAERVRGSQAALPSWEIGIRRAPEIPSRIHKEVAGAVPDGFLLLQRVEEGMFRLHPLVTVAPIDWALFEKQGSPAIQAVATAERKRG